ncbi:MAG: single-stranded-DNA-specific exonuclease RecJ, partial [Anaerolineae bacterium]
QRIIAEGVKLILTCDTGIAEHEAIAAAQTAGVEVIITDHHDLPDSLPPALAAINPKQAGCDYPFKELAGVGLAYKLAQALLDHLPHNGLQAGDYLDLVALGTIADLAPLYGENRKLAQAGLQRLNRALRPGLTALMNKVGSKSVISAGTIGFVIGPRLNAAGRLDSALAAYNLLMASTEFEAIHLAEQLDLQNRERQKRTLQTVEAARQTILADNIGSPLYFIHHPDFSQGVVGLAASRLAEEFYRPILVAERGPDITKGSARSIPEFHITEALDQCADLLVRYGGHAAAAGFTLKNEHVPAFQERLLEVARRNLQVPRLKPVITVDAEINLRGVNSKLVEDINALQPFGYGNPTPCFLTRNLTIKSVKAIGQDGHHLRLVLHDGKQVWQAIGFRQGYRAGSLRLGQLVDAVYTLEFNEWNGERQLQLELRDLRPTEGG